MKLLLVFLLSLTAILVFAQTKQSGKSAQPLQTIRGDTLIITSKKSVQIVQLNNRPHVLHEIKDGVFYLKLNEAELVCMFRLLELSAGPHIDVERIKVNLREQVTKQIK